MDSDLFKDRFHPGSIDHQFESDDLLLHFIPTYFHATFNQPLVSSQRPQYLTFSHPNSVLSNCLFDISNYGVEGQIEDIHLYYMKGTVHLLRKTFGWKPQAAPKRSPNGTYHLLFSKGLRSTLGSIMYRFNEKWRVSLSNLGPLKSNEDNFVIGIEMDTNTTSSRIKLSTDESIHLGILKSVHQDVSVGIDIGKTHRRSVIKGLFRYKNYPGHVVNQPPESLPYIPCSTTLYLFYPWAVSLDTSIWGNNLVPGLQVATRVHWSALNNDYLVSAGLLKKFKLPSIIPYPLMTSFMVNSRGTMVAMLGAKVNKSLKIGLGYQRSTFSSKFGLFIDI